MNSNKSVSCSFCKKDKIKQILMQEMEHISAMFVLKKPIRFQADVSNKEKGI